MKNSVCSFSDTQQIIKKWIKLLNSVNLAVYLPKIQFVWLKDAQNQIVVNSKKSLSQQLLVSVLWDSLVSSSNLSIFQSTTSLSDHKLDK